MLNAGVNIDMTSERLPEQLRRLRSLTASGVQRRGHEIDLSVRRSHLQQVTAWFSKGSAAVLSEAARISASPVEISQHFWDPPLGRGPS